MKNRISRLVKATVLTLVLFVSFVSLLKGESSIGHDYIDVGDEKQLFIDHKFIEVYENVVLKVNPPRKVGVAIKRDKPWESGALGGGMVFQYKGLSRYYYASSEFTKSGSFGKSHFCYAESKDGIHWNKPTLGFVEYNGSKDNNIFEIMGNVFLDPKAPEDQRLKMLALCGKMSQQKTTGLYLYHSSDGIHWTKNPTRVFPFWPDGTNQIIYNAEKDKYFAYFRQWFPRSTGTYKSSKIKPLRTLGFLSLDDINKPWPYDETIPKFYLWGKETMPTPSAEFTKVIYGDQNDPPETDIYMGSVVRYEGAANVWLAFPSVFRHLVHIDDDAGMLNTQLCVSRDGIHWTRYREPYVRLGLAGEGDNEAIYMGIGLVYNGHEIYQYYNGRSVPRATQPTKQGWAENYRLVQRLDGFISVDAPYEGGSFTTPTLLFTGARLELNVDTAAIGQIQVEILDKNNIPLSGFTLDNAELIQGNFIQKSVSWHGNTDVSQLAGKYIKLRFTMRSAKLYAFHFTE